MADLPDALRTEHWFCDLHHAMLIIMFERLIPALETEDEALADYFVDNLTMYWLQHCLMEEEGFAHAVEHKRLTPEAARTHAQAHMVLMQSWRDRVYLPFKDGAARGDLAMAAQGYYDSVVRHIETVDQKTYGVHSDYDGRDRTVEIAHISNTRLPLSPYMRGAGALAQTIVPDLATRFRKRNLGADANAPLAAMRLLSKDHGDGLRAVFRNAGRAFLEHPAVP